MKPAFSTTRDRLFHRALAYHLPAERPENRAATAKAELTAQPSLWFLRRPPPFATRVPSQHSWRDFDFDMARHLLP
jgi:hypothetical protein